MSLFSRCKKLTLAIAIPFGICIGLYGVAVYAQSAPSQIQCETAWSQSSASNSCGLSGTHDNLADISVSGNECKINVDCSTITLGYHINETWQGSVSDMSQLNNCDGELTVEACQTEGEAAG